MIIHVFLCARLSVLTDGCKATDAKLTLKKHAGYNLKYALES